MAEEKKQSADSQEVSWWRKVLKAAGVADPFVDAGILAGLAGLWWKLSSQGRGIPIFGGTPATSAPKLADEAHLDRILAYIEKAGGSQGAYFANHLQALHRALVDIDSDYGKQFRDKLFAGFQENEIVKRIGELFQNIIPLNDTESWRFLDTSKDEVVQVLLRYARRVENEIQGSINREGAAKIVAEEMIRNKELPGTALIHANDQRKKMVSDAAQKFAEWNAEHNKKAKEDQSNKKNEVDSDFKKILVWLTSWGGLFTTAFVLMMILIIAGQFTKQETSNPIAGTEARISKYITETLKLKE